MCVVCASHSFKAENSETKVGKTLSELTTKRVITIVLCIMFSLPIFDTTTYTTEDSAFNSSLSIIYRYYPLASKFKCDRSSLTLFLLAFGQLERK